MTFLNSIQSYFSSVSLLTKKLTFFEQITLIKNEIEHSPINVLELKRRLSDLTVYLKKASSEDMKEAFKVLNQAKDKILSGGNDWENNFKDLERKFIQADLKNWEKVPEARGKINQASECILKAFDDNLIDLNMQELELTSLPESVGQLSQLKQLYLAKNQLQFLPESFGLLSQLQILILHANRFTSLPKSLELLSQLRILNLNTNRLTSLPESFVKLSQLLRLNLGNNLLQSLPESFGLLSLMRTLYLSNNQLTFLPECFGQFSQLQELYLDNNQLESLPMSIAHCRKSLTYLNLKNNKNLKILPPSFEFLYLIQEIYISNTSINPEEVAALKVKWAAISGDGGIDAIQLLHIR